MILFRYLGGGWLPGVPARDLDQVDLDRLSAGQLAAVEAGHLYEPAAHEPDRHISEYLDELDLPGSIEDEE